MFTFVSLIKRKMITSSELKFAEKVMLIDAAYINKVTSDLSRHFEQVIGRALPKADLPVLLECLSMDAGIQTGNNVLQVLFIYDKTSKTMTSYNPSDLQKDLNDVAFKSGLGEFQLNSFEPSDMVNREEFFLESVKLIADAKEVKHLILVPSEEEYADKLPEILKKVEGKESINVFGMNPPREEVIYKWDMMGYAILEALGVRPNEIK